MNGPTFATAAVAPAPKAAPPRSAPPARPAARPDPDGGNGLRVLTYLRLHWLMILFCGTLLGAVGSYAAWELLQSKYESYALLQVSQVPATLATQNNPNQARTDFATYVKTASALLKSEFVLNAALRDLKDVPTIKDEKEPIKFLDEEVMVNWQDGSEVIRVTFKGHAPADVKKVVDNVQKAFMVEVVQKDVLEKRALLGKVEAARQAMEKLLADKSKRPDAPKPGPGVVPAAGVGAPGGVEPAVLNAVPGPLALPPPNGPPVPNADLIVKYDPKSLVAKFAHLQDECERLPVEIQIGRGRLRELEGKINALKTAPIDAFTRDLVEKDQDVIVQSIKMKQARFAHDKAAASGDKNAVGVIELRKAWEAHEARLHQMKQEKANLVEGAKRVEEGKKIAAEWEAVKHQVERMEVQFANAKAGLGRTEKQLMELPVSNERVLPDGRVGPSYDAATTDLMTLDGIFSRLVAQEQMLRYEIMAPPRVTLLQPASSPMQKDMKRQVVGTVAAALLGYFAIALGVVAFETLGRRVSSLADLKSAGPAPVVGVIPCLPGDATGRDPARRAAANEAIDKLRAYVAQTWLSRGATTVAVTSPLGDEGKAFAAFGLASSLAQAGYKTLAVDFDLREPALHTYAGVPNPGGVCEVLRGETDARHAIQTLPSGLDLLPAGKWSDEARKAAVGGRLEALLARLKEPYDCVVIHSHALLTVAESVEVARRCEVVLVCARYRETKVPLLRKATDRVAAMEIPYSGVVYVGATEQESLC